MSSARSVNDTLSGYLAGRVTAERVAAVVAAAYWAPGAGSREQLQPVMAVIERAHPGVVTLASTAERPGFSISMTERPFPRNYEPALREAVQAAVSHGGHPAPGSPLPAPSLWSRLSGLIRTLFTASR